MHVSNLRLGPKPERTSILISTRLMSFSRGKTPMHEKTIKKEINRDNKEQETLHTTRTNAPRTPYEWIVHPLLSLFFFIPVEGRRGTSIMLRRRALLNATCRQNKHGVVMGTSSCAQDAQIPSEAGPRTVPLDPSRHNGK